MTEFDDYTWKEVQAEFANGVSFHNLHLTKSTFDCLYNRDDPSADVLKSAPLITEHYILYEYLLSIFVGRIHFFFTYSKKALFWDIPLKELFTFTSKRTCECNFSFFHIQSVPEDGWAEAVENLWDSKARDNLRLPFSSSIILDMVRILVEKFFIILVLCNDCFYLPFFRRCGLTQSCLWILRYYDAICFWSLRKTCKSKSSS